MVVVDLHEKGGIWAMYQSWFERAYNLGERGFRGGRSYVKSAGRSLLHLVARGTVSAMDRSERGLRSIREYVSGRWLQNGSLEEVLTSGETAALEDRLEPAYIYPEAPNSLGLERVYVRYSHMEAPVGMREELVQLYWASPKTLKEVAADLSAKYQMPISASTISRRARQALGVINRREARRQFSSGM